MYLRSVYFPARDVLLGPAPRPLNSSNKLPLNETGRGLGFLHSIGLFMTVKVSVWASVCRSGPSFEILFTSKSL